MEPNFVEQLFFGLFFAPSSEGIYILQAVVVVFVNVCVRTRALKNFSSKIENASESFVSTAVKTQESGSLRILASDF